MSFDSDGGSVVESQIVVSGDTAEEPTPPTKALNTFVAWHDNIALGSVFNFTTPITGDITLYAEWVLN